MPRNSITGRRVVRSGALGAAFISLVAIAPAAAHTGVAPAAGLANGFMHPFGGIDHVLAMIAVGAWASLSGGRAFWALPATFLAAMLLGAAVAVTEPDVAGVELMIAMSVLVLGLCLNLGARLPVGLSAAMVGAFALFHGHAHGTELAAGQSAALYFAGFMAATIVLLLAGIVAPRLPLVRVGRRWAGAGIALAGVALLA